MLTPIAFVTLAAEAVFRIFPELLPAGTYSAAVVNPELGARLYSGPVIYNGVRATRREPNSLGFLDVEHRAAKRPDLLRVGFFGDSFVESVQVPLDQAFFRVLADRYPAAEPFAFGQSGWGTLHAKRSYDVFGERFALDVVLYVFVENDPGDNTFSVKAPTVSGALPLAVVSDAAPGYAIRWTRPPDAVWYSKLKSIVSRPLLLKALLLRAEALRMRGIRTRPSKQDFEMSARATSSRQFVPDPNLLPSSWPKAFRDEAKTLTERILRDWAGEVTRRGRVFGVIYVPRGQAQLRGEIPIDDTWFPWLQGFARDASIPMLDLTSVLRAASTPERPAYGDHWSPHGHRVVGEALAIWLPKLPRPPPP